MFLRNILYFRCLNTKASAEEETKLRISGDQALQESIDVATKATADLALAAQAADDRASAAHSAASQASQEAQEVAASLAVENERATGVEQTLQEDLNGMRDSVSALRSDFDGGLGKTSFDMLTLVSRESSRMGASISYLCHYSFLLHRGHPHHNFYTCSRLFSPSFWGTLSGKSSQVEDQQRSPRGESCSQKTESHRCVFEVERWCVR